MGLLKRMRSWDPFAGDLIERVDAEPLEGTRMSLWNSMIPDWWSTNINSTYPIGNAALVDSVWVANRCQKMNAQLIASMPIQLHGSPEPAWLSSPDPNLFPNGIGDALEFVVDQMYGWGFCCLFVTDYYSDGWPRTWVPLASSAMNISWDNGARAYKHGESPLDARRVIQIDRNPSVGLHGTSALRAYAQTAWGLLAAGNQSMTVTQGGIPQSVLKSQRPMKKDQAEALQEQWMAATSRRNGAPPVLPPDLDFEVLSINPSDLALLETQEWNAKVIATAYGVPAVALNMALQGGLTYQNPAALMEHWWRTELRPTSKRIADALSNNLLPRGQYVTFDASDMWLPLTGQSTADDPQAANDQPAPPAGQPTSPTGSARLTAVGT